MTTEATRVLRNTFYASIGFGVLAFQKAQVRRRELEASLRPQVESVGRHLRVVDGRRGATDEPDRR
jgi:hypothetical protein